MPTTHLVEIPTLCHAEVAHQKELREMNSLSVSAEVNLHFESDHRLLEIQEMSTARRSSTDAASAISQDHQDQETEERLKRRTS